MKKFIFALMIMFATGCEAAPYAFNALGFGVTQYLSSNRQSEIMDKMSGYDNQLVMIDRKIDLMLVHDEIDTSALIVASDTAPAAPVNAPAGDGGLGGLAGLAGLVGLFGAAWPFLRKAGTAYAKTQGIDDEKINQIADQVEKAVKKK